VRAGFDINTDVTLDVRPAASIIAERLQRIAQNAIDASNREEERRTAILNENKSEDIVDAEEVVEDVSP
jgi:hypothetical protein